MGPAHGAQSNPVAHPSKSEAPYASAGADRIGTAILRRLKPFDVHLHYFDRQRLPEAIEKELNVVFHPTLEDMMKVCDVVTSTHRCILRPKTCSTTLCCRK
jgi:hypothetical protein